MGTVDSLLVNHVNFPVTCVDRVGIAGSVQALQYEGGVVKFILQRGFPIPSPVVLTRNHDRLVKDIDRFVAHSGLDVVRFRKGDVKEDVARPYQEAAAVTNRPGVVLVGKAQERMEAWVGYKDSASPLGTERHPHFSFSQEGPRPRLLLSPRRPVGPGASQAVPLRPLPAVDRGQRPSVAQASARHGRGRL
jgi:hypothetical protein